MKKLLICSIMFIGIIILSSCENEEFKQQKISEVSISEVNSFVENDGNKDNVQGMIDGNITTTEPVNEEETISEYLIPNSDKIRLNPSDIVGYSSSDLRLARNEILARHGRMFNDESLQNYFKSKSWYHPEIEPDKFDLNMGSTLNEIELYNVRLIKAYEDSLNRETGVIWYGMSLREDYKDDHNLFPELPVIYYANADGNLLTIKGYLEESKEEIVEYGQHPVTDDTEVTIVFSENCDCTLVGGDGPAEIMAVEEFLRYVEDCVHNNSNLGFDVKVENGLVVEACVSS